MASSSALRIQFPAPDQVFFPNTPNVDLDHIQILITSDRIRTIGTNSLSASFAVCSRGVRADDTPVLAVWHKSPYANGQFPMGFKIMKAQMVAQGCLPNSIETFIIGGVNGEEGSAAEELQMERFHGEANVIETLYNRCPSYEEPLEVVVTPESIFVSNTPLFDSGEENKFAARSIVIQYPTN